jgi:heme-binding protein
MRMTATAARRSLYAALVGGGLAAVGAAAMMVPAATAVSDSCSAGGLANTMSSVSSSIGEYLGVHPDTNQALTAIGRQPPAQADASYRAYFRGNPQAAADLRFIQRPLVELGNQCGIQITPSQLMAAFQGL